MRTYKSLSSIRRYWTVLISSVFILTFGFIAYHKISIKKEPPFPTFPSSSMMIHLMANATPYNLMEDDIWIAFTQSPKPYEAKDCSRDDVPRNSETLIESPCSEYVTLDAEYANAHRLQQDHPCVIDIIRRHYLSQPNERELPYELDHPKIQDPSAAQSRVALQYFNNKTEGFFVECGALDGEWLSNTLYMERFLNWSGILIEADLKTYKKLMAKRRKAYSLPVCLSLKPYPTEVSFKVVYALGSIQEGEPSDSKAKGINERANEQVITAQCFPLYSILLAVGRTKVDFFSLDIEGHELKVLQTIPWHKVDIQTFTIESPFPERQTVLTAFMASKGYYEFGRTTDPYAHDLLFARNYSTAVNSD